MHISSLIAIGLGLVRLHAASESTTTLFVLVDTSGSTARKENGAHDTLHIQYTRGAFEVGRRIRRNQSLRVLGFAASTYEVFGGYPEDENAFGLLLENTLTIDPKRGTNFPLMLETLSASVKSCPSRNIQIVLFTDGLDDFGDNKTLQHRYRKAAKELAGDSRITGILFWGVMPKARLQLRDVFAPFGSRLTMQSNMEDINLAVLLGGAR